MTISTMIHGALGLRHTYDLESRPSTGSDLGALPFAQCGLYTRETPAEDLPSRISLLTSLDRAFHICACNILRFKIVLVCLSRQRPGVHGADDFYISHLDSTGAAANSRE